MTDRGRDGKTNKEREDGPGTRTNNRAFLSPATSRREFLTKNEAARRESKEAFAAQMENHLRKRSSGSLSTGSPATSRIPAPTQQKTTERTRNAPLTMPQAYELAKEQLAARAQGSPSPAPRPYRDNTPSMKRPLNTYFSQKPIGFGRRGNPKRPTEPMPADDTNSSMESFGSASRLGEGSDTEFERKLNQHAQDKKTFDAMTGKNGAFSKPKISPRAAEVGNDLARRTSTSKPSSASRPEQRTWGHLGNGTALKNFNKILKKGTADIAETGSFSKDFSDSEPIPFTGRSSSPFASRPSTAPASRSSDKSFAWQAEEEFTAGDLQFSNSPPVGFGRTNTKLDEIRALEIDAERRFPENTGRSPRAFQRTNTKLDEIRQLERDAESKYTIDTTPEASVESDDGQPVNGGNGPSFSPYSRTNTKLDEIRELEKKAPVTSRLGETKERKSPARSPSPEVIRRPSRDVLQDAGPADNVVGTPVTIYRNHSKSKLDSAQNRAKEDDGPVASSSVKSPSRPREDARDLLRRLARVTSNSPSNSSSLVEGKATDTNGEASKTVGATSDKKATSDENRPKVNGKEVESDALPAPATSTSESKPPEIEVSKPTVGFAGLPRMPSTDSISIKSKRSSMAHSDNDPTDRIEAEMKLFAPQDNQSEKGSIRAPSPTAESGVEGFEETPRPNKANPLTLPTPRVTGAYVETPATLKAGKSEDAKTDTISQEDSPPPVKTAPTRASRSQSGGQRKSRANSISTLRRSKSIPRARSPLRNSVKPPTVKDDLAALHRQNNMDDSTLEDFADLGSVEPELPSEDDTKPRVSDRDLEDFAMLDRHLKKSLSSMKEAGKGMTRLEEKIAQARHFHSTAENGTDPSTTCPDCIALRPSQSTGSFTYIPFPCPRLWRRKPNFWPTLLGWAVLAFTVWFALETTFYERWGKQEVCYGRCHSDWSDPEFGHVLPVKLDEWITGGVIRPHAVHWREEVSDHFADFWDWWTETDIREVQIRFLPWQERAQHIRRVEKKGLGAPFRPAPEAIPKIRAWERERKEQEEKEVRRELGYADYEDTLADETMDKDEPISREADYESAEQTKGWW